MTASALETIQSIIRVSNSTLTLLDTQNITDGELTTASEIFELSTQRESLIRLLFESNSKSELQKYHLNLQEIYNLDHAITTKSESLYHGTKTEVLKFKKNQKAINAYKKA